MKRFVVPILTAGLALLGAASLRAATWTVCATGCDDASISAAYAAAAAGDVINLEGDVTESDNFNRGINITVESTNGSVWTGVSTAPTLQFQNGNNSTVTLSGLTLDNQGDNPDLDWGNNGTADVVVDVEQCVLQNSSGAAAPLVDVDDANTEVVFITQSSLVGNGSAGEYGVELSGGINSLAVFVENTLLYGFNGSGSAGVYADNGNSWGGVGLQNDTFFNNAWGYYDASTSANGSSYTTLDDNVFIEDSAGDVHLDATNATVQGQEEAACVGNLFGDQTAAAGYGTGNIYLEALNPTLSPNLEASLEFVNPATTGTPNLHELAGAWSICAAVDDAQMPSVDKDGNARPSADCGDGVAGDTNGGGYDIGAYQYTGPAPTATLTATATPTATPTATASPSPGSSPSPTPTFSASPTPGPTPEPTATPAPFRLTPHYPNPDPAGSSGVYLPYSLSDAAYVTVRVYDVAGELVRAWSSDPEWEAAGDQQRFWDTLNGSGRPCASGVFLVQIDATPAGPGSRQEAWEKCALAR